MLCGVNFVRKWEVRVGGVCLTRYLSRAISSQSFVRGLNQPLFFVFVFVLFEYE